MTTTEGSPLSRGPRWVAVKLAGLFQLERLLAIVVVLIPLGLWKGSTNSFAEVIGWSEGPAGTRKSISAYHDLTDARWYYVPLAIGAMMFVVSGLVRPGKHGYNAFLGLGLFGIIWFDHDGASDWVHKLSTGVFLGFAMLLVAAQLSDYVREGINCRIHVQRIFFVGTLVVIALIAWLLHSQLNTLAAEWFLLSLIAVHFLIHSWMHNKYPAVEEPVAVLDTLIPGFKWFRKTIGGPIGGFWKSITS